MNPNVTKLPGIPRPPADASPALRSYLEALSEAIEIRLGRRGDPVDRAVTLRELISSGLAVELPSRPFNPNSPTDNTGFQDPTTAIDTVIPLQPTGFSASGGYSQVVLSWDFPNYSDHNQTEIWAHSADVIGDATLTGVDTGRIFVDPVGGGITRYYWIRHVNTAGTFGPWNSGTGTQASTATDVAFQLDVLANAITSGELATSLATPIAKIPGIETFTGYLASYSGGSLLTRMGAVETTASGAATSAALTTEATTRASADTALSNTVTTVSTTVGSNTNTIAVQAQSINGLSGQYTVKIDTNGAVAGFGLANTSTASGNIVSEFIVNADRFAIMRGGANTTAATVPFVVQATATTVNGEPVAAGVYMADAFIKNGSIANAKIGTLSADKITAGTISADRIAADSIVASKLSLNNSDLTSTVINGVATLLIGAAKITTAKIGNAAVGTLQVAGNAITATGYATKAFSNTNTLTLTMTAASNVTAGQPYIFVVTAIVNNTASNNAVLGGSTSSYDLKITTRSNGQSAQSATDWLYAWGTDTISIRRTSVAAGHAVSCQVQCFIHGTTTAVPSSRIQITGHTGLR